MTTETAVTPEAPAGKQPGRTSARRYEIVGIVGLVLCVVLGVVVLLGRVWVGNRVDGVFGAIDQGFGRGIALVDQTTANANDRLPDLEQLKTDVGAIAANSPIPDAIAGRLSALADTYAAARSGYAEVRSKVESTIATYNQAVRFMPFADLPTVPADKLAALDQRVTAFDERLTNIRVAAAGRKEAVVDALSTFQSTLADVKGRAADLRGGLDTLRAKVVSLGSLADTVLWIGAFGVLLAIFYVGVLNVLIIRLARRRAA